MNPVSQAAVVRRSIAAGVQVIAVLVACGTASAGEESNADVQQVLQLVIDLPALQEYYHVDTIPTRKPLIIQQDHHIPASLRLEKFGEPVRVMTPAQIRKAQAEAYLVISRLAIVGEKAEVEAQYPSEGLVIRVELTKKREGWKILRSSIVER